MKLSKEWITSEYLDQHPINDRDFSVAMASLGHGVQSHQTYWDIESPAQRPDCCSVVGIAREICAGLGVPFRYAIPTVRGCEDTSIFEMLDVDVWDDELCNRLTCRTAFRISLSPSPDWLQRRLLGCGITPVNCIEDIAQYVKLELGQPLMILDQRCCSGSLILRQAFPGELDEESVVLADEMHPIMIGNTIVDEAAILSSDTDSIIIFALSDPSDSQDPMLTHTAVQRMCQLIETINCGTVADGTIDILNYVPFERRVPCLLEEINDRLNITESSLAALLQPTGITLDNHECIIPSHRLDLNDSQDLLKEIERIHTAQAK
jgi:phenylalanyl-tRNA synthetase beta chain